MSDDNNTVIDLNFDDTPLSVPPITPGVYDGEIIDLKIDTVKNDATKRKVVVTLKIITDGPFKDRQLSDHIGLANPVRIKRMITSALGAPPTGQGIPIDAVKGKICKFTVDNSTQIDQATGKSKINYNVKEYLIDEKFDRKA